MERLNPDTLKHREIGFCDLHPDPNQARSALLMLGDVDGITHASIPDAERSCLRISYDLKRINLRVIEALLNELGFHLENTLLAKLKRALYYFTEENEMQSLQIQDDQDHSTREIFMRCYRCKTHGCRDERPDHWRSYL